MNLPAFRLFIDLLAGEGGHCGIEALHDGPAEYLRSLAGNEP